MAASAGEKRTALALSAALTMAMFGVLMLASFSTGPASPAAQVLVAFDLRASPPEPQGQQAPAAARPAPAASAPAPAPRPASTRPAPLRLPVVAIDLAPPVLPQMTVEVPLVSPEPAGGISQEAGSAGGGAGEGSGKGDGGDGSGGGDDGGGNGGRKLFASWAPSMDFRKDNRHYPAAARSAKVEGVAWMRCLVVRNDRVRDCTLLDEEPRGYGFGKAALKTVPGLRLRLHDERGERVYDDWTIVTSTFTLDDLPEYRQAREQTASAALEPAP
jgi:hypothetical protein